MPFWLFQVYCWGVALDAPTVGGTVGFSSYSARITVTTTSSPGALGMPSGGAEKGVNSKQERFYLAGNWGGTYCGGTDGNRIFKFDLSLLLK